jgi:hypothetical protein
MIEYIYFVKCPCCEDEPFDFFDDAKGYAMGCLSKKPVITQTEVCRNDFGECTNSADLGTIWSWEDLMKDVPADNGLTILSKADTFECDDDYFNCEFTDSIDSVPDNFRKPVPTNMTIEALVEEMEENEDTVECKVCEELFEKAHCHKDPERGWVCEGCSAPSNDSWKQHKVTLEYPKLNITVQSAKQIKGGWPGYEDWDEWNEDVFNFQYEADPESVAESIWELMTEEDAADVPGGLDALEDNATFDAFMNAHLEELVEKYYTQLLDIFEDYAKEAAEKEHLYNESVTSDKSDKEFLQESDDPIRLKMTMCPECGIEEAYDHKGGFCTSCGYSIIKEDVASTDTVLSTDCNFIELNFSNDEALLLDVDDECWGPQTVAGEPDSGTIYNSTSLRYEYDYKIDIKRFMAALFEIAPELADDPRCDLNSNTFDIDYIYAITYYDGKYHKAMCDYFREAAIDAMYEDYYNGDKKILDAIDSHNQDLYDNYTDGYY